jgi:hypothetical protein
MRKAKLWLNLVLKSAFEILHCTSLTARHNSIYHLSEMQCNQICFPVLSTFDKKSSIGECRLSFIY